MVYKECILEISRVISMFIRIIEYNVSDHSNAFLYVKISY